MSKRRKGVSLDEKRERILRIYTETKQVYNLKEIEKLGAKAGVVLQTIKDVNQALVDDGLVDSDKIGSGNYFWSFPSKLHQKNQNRLNELQNSIDLHQKKMEKLEMEFKEARETRELTEERTEKMTRFKSIQQEISALETEFLKYKDNDPAILDELASKIKEAKEGADRWTDNVWCVKSWIVKRRNCPGEEVDKWLGIDDSFDYIE